MTHHQENKTGTKLRLHLSTTVLHVDYVSSNVKSAQTVLKCSMLEPKRQKYKGRVGYSERRLWSYAVFTEQGSSASQMIAAEK